MSRARVLLEAEDFEQIPKMSIPQEMLDHGAEELPFTFFTVERIETTNEVCICYKGIPLWRTAIPIEKIVFFLLPAYTYEEEGEYFTEPACIICRDVYGDFYTYGYWDTTEEARQWLKNPKIL